jgi:hypothetical protein
MVMELPGATVCGAKKVQPIAAGGAVQLGNSGRAYEAVQPRLGFMIAEPGLENRDRMGPEKGCTRIAHAY